MVSREINLLSSLPKSKRDIKARAKAKDPNIINIAKQFGYDYFDGDRKYGYGGYYYDSRWRPVARDIIEFFKLKKGSRVLDVGCGKGFLVWDLMKEKKFLDVRGLDISKYAIENCPVEIAHRMYLGSAKHIPFMDKFFDLVISINTLHNLPRDKCVMALKEIERVSKGNSYIVVDSYYTPEEKMLFESWALTPEFHDYPEGWLKVFEEAGYTGAYSWNILS
jgi:ubiquinone/menaquinone biosynthesis C-methylase UbiE